jgi:AMP-polyphosphate phosphotransferase
MPNLKEPVGLKKGKHLDDLEHRSIEEAEYKPKLKEAQLLLLNYQRELAETKRSVIIIFEGPDAAGKGGAIKRVTERLDPRLLRVHSIVKPTAEEYQQHYLWRFWKKLPPRGQTVIFDRSWYGRVLVERVERLHDADAAARAHAEIADFERSLVAEGMVLVKFWLHLSAEQQLDRFEKRKDDPLKAWKLTEEDWRNREKREEYAEAVELMFERTSLGEAPWTLVEGEQKKWARVRVVETVADALEAGLAERGRRPAPG